MPTPDARLALAALEAAGEMARCSIVLVQISVVYRGADGITRTHTLSVEGLSVAPPSPAGGHRPDTDGLSDVDRSILATLRAAEVPLKPSAVARRAGKKYGPHFRSRCKKLKEKGLIQETGEGLVAVAADRPDTPPGPPSR